jgi:hypothetical protein
MTADLIAAVGTKYNLADVNPKLAAFALLGMLNWTYQWYKASGPIRCDEVIRTFQQLFLNALLGRREWTGSRSLIQR